MSNEPTMPIPASWFRREWVCKADTEPDSAEDYECDSSDPHNNYGCGYFWRASFSDARWNTLQKQLRMKGSEQ